MSNTDKYGMTNEELLERYSNLSVDDYKELLAEVKRLREALDWVRREETRKEADYIWEGVEEILAGDPRWKELIE